MTIMRSAIFGTLVLLVTACSPGAGENQEEGVAGPAGEVAYDGVLFRRGNVVVSDLDRAYKIWIDLFGMQIDTVNTQDADSLAYDLFNVPKTARTRFATLNAGPEQARTLGIYEVTGVPLEAQDGIRRGSRGDQCERPAGRDPGRPARNGPEHAAREDAGIGRSAGWNRNGVPRLGRQPHRPL